MPWYQWVLWGISFAAFLMSATTWLLTFIHNKVKLAASNVLYSSIWHGGQDIRCAYVSMCLSNNSYHAVSIDGVDFVPTEENSYPADRRSRLYLGASKDLKRAQIWSTPIPINLDPFQSKDILLAFPMTAEELSLNHLPPSHKLPGTEDMQSSKERVNQLGTVRGVVMDDGLLQMKCRFQTTHRSVDLPLTAKFANIPAQMECLIRASDLGFE